PPDCPISLDDVHWAFSGVEWFEPTTGEILWNLVPAAEHGMLRRYGVDRGEDEGHRNWRTVTPAALPMHSARRRIDPSRPGDKGAAERLREEGRAVAAVRQALRHAQIGV